jgi:predicted PhzF superfamily epimerase YddE/YHI9
VTAAALSHEVVDVLTDGAFAGNPLAVVLDADAGSTVPVARGEIRVPAER